MNENFTKSDTSNRQQQVISVNTENRNTNYNNANSTSAAKMLKLEF